MLKTKWILMKTQHHLILEFVIKNKYLKQRNDHKQPKKTGPAMEYQDKKISLKESGGH